MISHCMKRFRICIETRSIQLQCRDFMRQYTGIRYRTTVCPDEDSEPTRMLLQLCVDRHYVAPGEVHRGLFERGMCCNYGPLGMDLKKNLLEQWWRSVTMSRTQVFGISTLTTRDGTSGEDKPILDVERLNQILDAEELTKAQLIQRIRMLHRQSPSLRTNLLQGALEQYSPWSELVNRRLPFGLAETGLSFQPMDGSVSCDLNECASPFARLCFKMTWEVLSFCQPSRSYLCIPGVVQLSAELLSVVGSLDTPQASVVEKEFSSQDVPEEELQGGVSRGVKIVYSFPWGQETLENLWCRGDSELLQTHGGVRAKIQCRDGRKLVVPHVVSLVSNMDRSMMAYMHNSLQLLKKQDGKQKLYQRKVLKLHPVLAPVKVALDMGRGATLELRQVCEGLLQEFLEAGISTWPGYIDATSSSVEKLNIKYDEMGVLFTIVIDENTLESGLLQVRSRDTTIKEFKHISEAKGFLLRYIRAARNM